LVYGLNGHNTDAGKNLICCIPTRGRYCYKYLLLTNFTELELTNIQANYWLGQMHCGLPNGPTHGPGGPSNAVAPPWFTLQKW